jgi:O-antigen/teichoic acid export membrane protein
MGSRFFINRIRTDPISDAKAWFSSAAVSGLLLRVIGGVFNLVAIPIALQSLGREKFAAAGALLGLAAWLTIGNGGLGTATTMLVAQKSGFAEEDRSLVWQGIISGFFASIAMFAVAALLVPILTPLILPHAPKDVVNDFLLASYSCCAAVALSASAMPFEGIEIGLLNINYCNMVRLLSQLFAILLMFVLGRHTDSILIIALLMVLGPTSASIWFLIKGILDWPLPDGFRFSFGKSLPLLSQGYGFMASSLAVLFFGGGSLPLFAISFGPEQVATATVIARIVQVYYGVLFVLLLPTRVAVRRAHGSGDAALARKTLLGAGAALLCTSATTVVAVLFAGQLLIKVWVGVPLLALNEWLVPLAVMISAASWCITWVYLAHAVQGSYPAAKIALGEIAMASVLYLGLGKHLTPSSSLYVLAGSMLFFSGLLLPLRIGPSLFVLITRKTSSTPAGSSNR